LAELGQDLDSTSYLVKRLFLQHVRVHAKKLIFAVLCMVVIAFTTAALAYMMKPVLDDVFLAKDGSKLVAIALFVAFVGLLKGLATYGQLATMRYIGQRIITEMQMQLYKHLLYADLAFFGKESSGKLVSRFTNDIVVMRRSVSHVLTATVKELLTVIFLVGVMVYQSPFLAFITFFVFPLAVVPILFLGRRMRKISGKIQEELGRFTERLDETFKGVRVIKAYCREGFELKRARVVLEDTFRWYFKAIITEAMASPMMEMLGVFSVALVIWYGGGQVIEGVTTPGAFFSFIVAFTMAYKPVKTLSGLNLALQEGLAAAKRLFNSSLTTA